MFFRTLAIWALGLPLTAFIFLVIMATFVFDRSGRAIHAIVSLWARLILLLSGVRVRVEGMENIPRGKAVVFLSNHQGAFDIPVLQGFIPVQFRWIAKKSLFRIPLIGWSMSFAGYIAIDRENAAEALRSMEAAASRIRSGTSVLIFPEGTRSETGKLLPFKRGGFMLASKSGVPIVPVAVSGTNVIMRRGGFSVRPASVRVSFGHPIETGGAEDKDLRNRTKQAIEALYTNIQGV
ncbi:MAG: 1-acyl-sn-glycerol-3-phosphate acyltransferase [Deltaproteobacteria bacterium]|nr:1-acyl-sn-glycerol-3-phosphate acyltransferase [Deltaproteobacteria bacterium]